MGRIVFPQGEQNKFINKILVESKSSIQQLAKICNVSERTIRDWKREKFTLSEIALLKIQKKFHVAIPKGIKRLGNYWYIEKGAKLGGLKHLELYGPPGTPEGRKKGGKVSQQRRRENPEKYRELGCIIRKNFIPLKESKDLSEMIGIILGDGGITQYQVAITLGNPTDREYAKYVQNLMAKIFGELPSWYEHEKENYIDLCISGRNLVENLKQFGVEKGNKIDRQIDIPEWIWKKKEYQTSCVRGLVDTDGGVYFHKHWTKGVKYRHLGLCFTSWSKPLIESVSRILSAFGIKHTVELEGRIYIYSLDCIKKYFSDFGSHNPKHSQKLKYHLTHDKILNKIAGGVA